MLNGLHIVDGNATGIGGYTGYGITYDVGGGIFVEEANVTIENCVIEQNIAGDKLSQGGGIFLHNGSGQVKNNTIQYNKAGEGGGVSTLDGAPVFLGNKILHNNATYGSSAGGGGIYCTGGNGLISQNLIQDNNSSRDGGGISLSSTDILLKGNYILHNRAVSNGGGIMFWYDYNHHSNNIVAHNYAGHGGGIWAGGSKAVLVHTTIADNENGGIYIDKTNSSNGFSNMTLINTIISREEEGMHVADGSHAAMEGVLFWNNTADVVTNGSATVDLGSIIVNGNPDFKNPVGGDYHITGFSAAVDAGADSNLSEDIDGDIRPIGSKYDIGADETPRSSLAPMYYLLF